MREAIWIIGVALLLGIAHNAWAQEAQSIQSTWEYRLFQATYPSEQLLKSVYSTAQDIPVVRVSTGQTVTLSCSGASQAGKFNVCPTQYAIEAPSDAIGLIIEMKGVRGTTLILIRHGRPIELTEAALRETLGFEISRDGAYLWSRDSTPPFRSGTIYVGFANGITSTQTYTITFTISKEFKFELVRLSSGESRSVTCEGTSKPHESFMFCPQQFYIDVPSGTTKLEIDVRGSGDLFVVHRVRSQIGADEPSYRGWRSREGRVQQTLERPETGTHYFALGNFQSSSQRMTITVTISKAEPPRADFTADPRRGPAPLTVQFTDRSTGEITSWSWSFGDGGTSSEKNPRYTYRTPGTFTVRLTVRGPGGENTKSESDYITVIGPPRAPSNLMATVRSQTQIDLSWRDNADNEEGFEIFRKIQGQSYSLLSRAVSANSTSYSDTGLSPNTTYCYQVRAHNTAGSSEFSNEACATIPPTPPPPPPPPTQIPSFDFTATAELGRMAMIPLPDPIKNQLPAVGVRFVELPNTTRRERTSSSLKDVGLDVNPDTGTILGTPNKAGEFQFLLEARSDTTVLAEIWAIITIKRDGPPPAPPPPPPPTGMGTLVSGVPQKGTVTAGPKALSEQFTITVLEGTWTLLIKLQNQGTGNINLHVRLGKPVEIVAGEIVADFSSNSPTGTESISLAGPVQPGTYYIAVENTESTPQNFTILAAVVPVLQMINSGEPVSGKADPAPLGGRVLLLTQYVIEVPEGAKSLSVVLENLGLGDLNLHLRYGKPVEIMDNRIVADFSSDSPLGVEALTIAGASLKAGKYYIAVENVEPYAQEFKLTVLLTR